MPSPIRAFVGFNGGGKTLAAMEYVALPALNAGRPVYATFGIDHPNAHLLTSWRELATLEGCTVILDEMTAALPSRQAMALPPQLARVLNQLRKVDVQLCWTAPSWARADKLVREVTQTVTTCRGMLPDRYVRDEVGHALKGPDGKRVRADREWAPNRLFRFVTYGAEDFDEFTISASRKLKAKKRSWYWRPRHEAHRLYSTLAGVELLDHLDLVGTCVICGGKKAAPRCTCAPTARGSASEGAQAPIGGAPPVVAPMLVDQVLDVVDHREHEAVEAFDSVWGAGDEAAYLAHLAGHRTVPDEGEAEWVRAFWGEA